MTIEEANESSTEQIAIACAEEMMHTAANVVKHMNQTDMEIREIQVGRAAAYLRNQADALSWLIGTMEDHPQKSRLYMLELLEEKKDDRQSSIDAMHNLIASPY